jgi:proliferating cell nuclear antigen
MTLFARAPVSVFEEFLSVPHTIVEEGKLRFDADGLRMRVVDPANVGMVDVTVDESQFEEFTATDGVIGVSISRLSEVISMADSGMLVEVELDEEIRKLNVEIGGVLSYTIALIDPDSVRTEPDIPALDLPAEIEAPSSEIDRGLRGADMVSDHVELSADVDEKSFHISADGDTDSVDTTLNGETLTEVDVSESCTSTFSLDYLTDMSRAIPGDALISFEIGGEMPVRFEFETSNISAKAMIAPRVTS